jgi:hypothetical protein
MRNVALLPIALPQMMFCRGIPCGCPQTGDHEGRPTDARSITLTLTDFVIPPDDVPQEVSRAIKHWSQWIDYWAVDWDDAATDEHIIVFCKGERVDILCPQRAVRQPKDRHLC